jgi:hypothetical protein
MEGNNIRDDNGPIKNFKDSEGNNYERIVASIIII